MVEECADCKQREKMKFGGYDAKCVTCCAVEVMSAKSHAGHKENIIDALIKFEGSPSREKILNRVKELAENS